MLNRMTTSDGPEITATDLLNKANNLPYGEEERDVLHEALVLTQETGDEDAEYRVRLALTASYRNAEDNAAFLTHFSAAVGMHDRDPQRFPGESDGTYPDLFWQYKHAINVVTMSCVFSRAQADAMLDQMDTHFRNAGVPETAVDIERRDDAIVNGEPATALALQARIDAAGGEDPFDDCPTCRLAGRMDLCLATGDLEGAHGALMQILDVGNVGCVMEPETSLSRFMLIALKNDDTDLARFAQQTSASANPRFQGLDTVGLHLEFLGVTGNYTRGLGLLQRYQRDLTTDPLATGEAFGFLAGAWVLLTATQRAGFGAVVVSGSGAPDLQPFYGPSDTDPASSQDFTVAELAGRCEAAAVALGERYDQRNGNDNFTRRVAEVREHSALDLPLDLGSTNLLLRAEIADRDRGPVTGREHLDRLLVSLYTMALVDAAELASTVPDVDGADLLTFLGCRVRLYDLTSDDKRRAEAFAEYVAELQRQGRPEASFISGLTASEWSGPSPDTRDRWRAEVDRLRPADATDIEAVRSFATLSSRFIGTLLQLVQEPDAPESALPEARERLSATVDLVREAGLLKYFGVLAANLFSLDMATGEVEDPRATYLELRRDLPWPHTVPLDSLFSSAAAQAGVEDGFAVTDQLLNDLIDLGLREVTARVALESVDNLAGARRFGEAAERANLALREIDAAGRPGLSSRDASLKFGEMLVYADRDAEGRDILEPLLLPKLDRYSTDNDIEFSPGELDALFTLGIALKNTGPNAEAAAFTLLRTRDLAAGHGNHPLAVAAVTAFTDLAHGLDEYDAAVAELTATLPSAEAIEDDGWSETRLRDRIAVIQSDADNPAALDTLSDNMSRARNLQQRIYVQESFNRVLHTFGRLDDCLAGCDALARMILDGEEVANGENGDTTGDAADMAAAQLFQGAQYAVWSDDLPAAVTMIEKSVAVPGVSAENLVGYYRNLSRITGELGRTREASAWEKKADKLAASLGE